MSLCPLPHLLDTESAKVHAEWKSACCPSGTSSQTGVRQPCSAESKAAQSGDVYLGRVWTTHDPGHRLDKTKQDTPPKLRFLWQLTRWLLVPALTWAVAGREVAVPPDRIQGRLPDAFCGVPGVLASACGWSPQTVPTASHFGPYATWGSKLTSFRCFCLGSLLEIKHT